MAFLGQFIRKNTVLSIAIAAAIITSFIIPPDGQYLGYVDLKTMCCLFGTLAVVCALKNIRFFAILASRIILIAGNSRTAAVTLVFITFFGSMLIANDMALITFLPLGYYVFSTTGDRKEVATVFILQNIAANLGGMLTPFGNPQNLYMYAKYAIPTGEFMRIMAAPFLVALIMIIGCCFLIPKHSMKIIDTKDTELPVNRTVIYLILFAISILMVFRIIPYWLAIVIVLSTLLILDRKAIRMVDYGLLFTFVSFFIFAGNMGRIGAVQAFFSRLLNWNPLITSVFSCQVISNVPSAILLSQFTENYMPLLLGVNIGGAGTLIASLASLITFGEYNKYYPGSAKEYILRFSAYNFSFVIILTLFGLIFLI
ncbi:MAG: citrate transporter [Clostridia bacterium]|nr:citrate transporter [Clostridia bacterium]